MSKHKYVIEFETGNSDFQDIGDIQDALKKAIERFFDNALCDTKIYDINGNVVGTISEELLGK